MSSVLVRGMDMPKICNECDFCTYVEKDRDVWCTSTIRIIKRGITRPEYEYQNLPRPDWCPLVKVKSHERLIDADALIKALVRKEPFNDCARVVIAECMEEVRHAPTVIEAEGGT